MEVFKQMKVLKKPQISQDAKVVASNAAMKTAVLSDKNGIGFISFGTVDNSVKAICIDNRCPSNETEPQMVNIISQEVYIWLQKVSQNL